MSKVYKYFEAMEEIMNDRDKTFRQKENIIMLFNHNTESLNIVGSDIGYTMDKLTVNDNWINTKWILVEDKKNYNVRVYNVSNDKLIHSEVVEMTKHEVILYCNSKTVLGEVKKIRDGRNNTLFIIREMNKTRVICEEIVTT